MAWIVEGIKKKKTLLYKKIENALKTLKDCTLNIKSHLNTNTDFLVIPYDGLKTK